MQWYVYHEAKWYAIIKHLTLFFGEELNLLVELNLAVESVGLEDEVEMYSLWKL